MKYTECKNIVIEKYKLAKKIFTEFINNMNLKTLPIVIKKYILIFPTKATSNLCRVAFNPLIFTKHQSIDTAKLFALKNFKIKKFEASKISEYNEINSICTKIYNLTEGEAKFPPEITLKNSKNTRYDGDYSEDKINLIKHNSYMQSLIHEIGHYNHEKMSSNYLKMGKLEEIKNDMFYPDYSIYNKFMKDSKNLKLIKTYLGGYATSSPAEFVAEFFTAAINNKKLPKELFNLYKEYEGPCADILFKQYQKLGYLL